VSVEEEGVAGLIGGQLSRKGQYIVMVWRMRFRWVRGEKVESNASMMRIMAGLWVGVNVQGEAGLEQVATVERDNLLSKKPRVKR
jgi:hypothetical protein